jgi:lysophospholipase L1-like esterase
MVLLLLGSNDGLRGLKTSETEKNLNQTIEWAKSQKIQILCWGSCICRRTTAKNTREDFAQVYKSVAQKNKVPLLGIFTGGNCRKARIQFSRRHSSRTKKVIK